MSKIFFPRKSQISRLDNRNRLLQIDANRNLDSILENSSSDSDSSDHSFSLTLNKSVIASKSIMSADLVDQVYKALRLLPEFDGNPNVLTRFVHLCDQLVVQFIRAEPGFELSNLSLLNGILNKITGPAARTINSNGIPENWQGIRNALINNFSDQRDETALYNDLALLTQRHLSPQEFYEKCQSLFSTIMTYVTLHENIATTIEAKRALYKKLTLQAYVRGLREPLGSRIRCMRPETIEKALEFVHEEMNTLYLQQRNDHLPERKMQPTSSFDPTVHMVKPFNLPPSRPLTFSPPFNNMPGPSNPTRFQPPRPTPGWKPQMSYERGPTRTQQMFGAPLTNYRPQSNVFRVPQQRPGYTLPHNGPKPMSGVSHYVAKPMPRPMTGHDWTRHGNPPPTNYFKTREMNFNEFDFNYYDHPEYNYDCYEQTYFEPTYEPTYEIQPYTNDYIPAYVEESQEEATAENQDFQVASKLEKPK